ncbi:uncharacterized protein LODBEIA_P09140 [Lodderomyces beijingensis]|uniref:Major facilitator superfamily (MFS) profile domain-containing protein n=1 Tax=Lodderomyces beijingensis TaxID=1775926 RepID=A0ABP0ZK67_9ASCO
MSSIESIKDPLSHADTLVKDDKLAQATRSVTGNQSELTSDEKAHPLAKTTKSIGVKRAELMNMQLDSIWLKACFFFSIFIVAYAYGIDANVRGNLTYYATSSYQQHSLLTTVGVMQAVIAAAAQPFYARLSDRFGRMELFILGIVFSVIGTIIQSRAYEIKRFAAGAVFYQLGFCGIIIMTHVILADFSNLNWRLACSAVPGLPFLINTWVGGDILASVLAHYSWQWGIGMWAFILPLACLPLISCFIYMTFQARKDSRWESLRKQKEAPIPHSKKTLKFWTTLALRVLRAKRKLAIELFWDLNLVGLFNFLIVFGFILVPLTLAGGVSSQWAKASTIVPLVIGVVWIPVFIIWEAKFARSPIMPFSLMKDRGVWAAILVIILFDIVFWMAYDFMYTVLIVGMNASVRAAARIVALYGFVTALTGVCLGLVVTRMRRLKLFIIFGCSMCSVAMGILLHFRGTNDGIESEKYIRGVIGGLCFFGFSSAFLTFPTQVSIATCTNHEHMSVIIAVLMACYWIGQSIGTSISGAIWTNKMYNIILANMIEMNIENAAELAFMAYGSAFEFAALHPWGTPARVAVAFAYAQVQKYLCMAGLIVCFPMIVFAFLLRDHKLLSVQALETTVTDESGSSTKDGDIVVNSNDDDIVFAKIKSIYRSIRR